MNRLPRRISPSNKFSFSIYSFSLFCFTLELWLIHAISGKSFPSCNYGICLFVSFGTFFWVVNYLFWSLFGFLNVAYCLNVSGEFPTMILQVTVFPLNYFHHLQPRHHAKCVVCSLLCFLFFLCFSKKQNLYPSLSKFPNSPGFNVVLGLLLKISFWYYILQL